MNATGKISFFWLCFLLALTDSVTIGGLQFKGIDSDEAEAFISAIRQKAFSEGKQDDDKWTANFASTCFTGRALRWHGSLDRETQRDWHQLQKAILTKFSPTFKGIDGQECEAFIHDLRQRIFEEGKEEDHGWIARYVATRVTGDALRWHASLDEEIQLDWRRLQRAMLAQYPPPGGIKVPSPKSVIFILVLCFWD